MGGVAVGSFGLELWADWWERVMDAGKAHNITPPGPSDIHRIEAGILNYGADMTLENNPYELDLGWMVNLLQEGNFIGKGALERIKADGAKQKLIGIKIDGDPIEFNMTKWPVSIGSKDVGIVTSAVYSPRFGNNGYAWLPIEYTGLGTSLTIHHPEKDDLRAEVVEEPFVDPKKDIPKS